MNSNSSKVRRLTYNLIWDSKPIWSPDVEKIAFASLLDGAGDIYVMDADGGNLMNLTNNPNEDGSPSSTQISISLHLDIRQGISLGEDADSLLPQTSEQMNILHISPEQDIPSATT